MSRIALSLAAALCLILTAVADAAPPSARATGAVAEAPGVRATPPTLGFRSGRVLIALDDAARLGASPSGALSPDPQLAGLLASVGIESARALGPEPRGRAAGIRFFVLESSRPGFDPPAAAAALRAGGAFRAVMPDYRFALFPTFPDDPYLSSQWYVDDAGSADIRLPAAWDIARGDPGVVIAILDTGVDTGHPDLATQIWINPGEIPGNGVDDDGNGLTDDVQGWDFGSADNDPNPEYTPDASGIDVGFHGTFCAGIAAAATDNGAGIAGAGWECRIMALKVSHPVNGLTSEAIAAAMVYAVEEGAAVISMSFGGPGDPGVPEFFQALVDMANAAGVMCVAAAGNDGSSTPVYPAACDGVLAVAATDPFDARAEFSNWGPWVDIAAPGSLMWSSICRNYVFTDLDQLIYLFFFGWDGVNPYMYGDGTSFACPLTAGVAGLVRDRFPGLTPAQVAAHLIATGDVVPYDQPIGPKVNAFQAVSVGPTAVEPMIAGAGMHLAAPNPNPASGPCTIVFAAGGQEAVSLAVFDGAGRRVRELYRGAGAGPQRVTWDGRDDLGRTTRSGVYFVRLAGGSGALQRKLVRLAR